MFVNRNIVLLFACIVALSITSTKCYSNTDAIIEKDGYRVLIDWNVSGGKLTVRGMIKEGNLCKKLNISLHITNTKGGSVYIKDSVNYQITTGVRFKGSDDYYRKGKIGSNKDWFVSDLYLECM